VNWLLKYPQAFLAAGVTLWLAGALALTAWWVLRPSLVQPQARASLPAEGFDHGPWAELLARFRLPSGELDYGAWAADSKALEALEQVLANLAATSPEREPKRFPGDARLAYWLNAYNACVVAGVLRRWPLESVKEVGVPLLGTRVGAGAGFFVRQRFLLGGRSLSLHSLEQDLIRVRFPEERVHFVLNCASRSCPPLGDPPRSETLEATLSAAQADFLGDPETVQVDAKARVLRVNAILTWYRADFLAALARLGIPAEERSLARYLREALPARRAELEAAEDYRVEALPYDWSVNGPR